MNDFMHLMERVTKLESQLTERIDGVNETVCDLAFNMGTLHGKHEKRLAALEEKVSLLDKAYSSAMQSSVHRIVKLEGRAEKLERILDMPDGFEIVVAPKQEE